MILDAAELKRRYLLRIAGARDNKAYIGPEVVSLGISDACNVRCVHCETHTPGNSHHYDKIHFFSWDKFLGVIRDCVELNVDEIEITGKGEPMTHPMFREMLRHLEQQPLRVKLFTNATFPLDYCPDVIKADHVVVDLCAVDRQQYIELQGKDMFDRVIANLERLVAMRDAQKPGFIIEIVYIVNALNTKQMLKMRALASQLGVNRAYFRKMIVHAYNQEIALPKGPMSDLEGDEKNPPVCLNGWFYMTAMSNGDLTTCCEIHQMPLGDFDKYSLKDIWLSPQMMSMRLMGKYGDIQKKYKACLTCFYYDKNIQRSKALASLEKKG